MVQVIITTPKMFIRRGIHYFHNKQPLRPTCIFYKVIKDAKTPLEVGPGSRRLEQLGEVGQQLLKGRQECISVGREHSMDYITDLKKILLV